jgi:putative thiamine transport system ATP-binding protein
MTLCVDIAALGNTQRTLLRGLRFEVPPGAVLTLMGPSGCGKSSVLAAIAGTLDSGAEDAEPQARFARIHPLLLELVGDRQHVAGRDHDDVGLEILDQLHLALGLAAAKGHHGQAQAFGAVMRTQAAGEQAIAVAHMHHVAGLGPGGADAAGAGAGDQGAGGAAAGLGPGDIV